MQKDGSDNGSTILVVEEEALVAMMVADMLAEAGFAAACATGDPFAAPGTAAAAETAAGAVVDLRLAGGLDGRDVLRGLRRRRPALPAVVVTGYAPSMPEADLRGLGGPTGRVIKPFQSGDLLGALAAVLRAPAPIGLRRRAADAARRPTAAPAVAAPRALKARGFPHR